MDPISPFLEMGLSMGAVILCTGLFIWNTIEINSLKKQNADVMTKLTETHTQMAQAVLDNRIQVSKHLDDQAKFMSKIHENQTLLASNLLHLTNTVNQVVRELIDVIREVE
jgi:hypothetical protein